MQFLERPWLWRVETLQSMLLWSAPKKFGGQNGIWQALKTSILNIGENQQLVTDEPVEVQDCRRITNQLQRNLWNIPQINIEKPKDVNM